MKKFLCLLLFPLLALAAETPEQQFIRQVIDVMTPIHAQWVSENEKFYKEAQTFCSKGTTPEMLRQQWRATQQSWSALNAFAIGPLTENGYLNTQVQYWPDKKNLVEFQMRDALEQHKEAINVAQLSVALRGLSASEFILFDMSVNLNKMQDRQRYCPLLLSIADYQQNLSHQVQEEWRQYVPTMTIPNRRFATSHDVLAEWLRVQVSAMEIQHKRIALPLGNVSQGKSVPQPYLAEYWRSGQSLASVRTSIRIHHQVWDKGWRHLVQAQDKALADRIDFSFNSLEQQTNMLPAVPELLKTDAGKKSLRDLYTALDELRSYYESAVAKTLNIQIGFNANDGD